MLLTSTFNNRAKHTKRTITTIDVQLQLTNVKQVYFHLNLLSSHLCECECEFVFAFVRRKKFHAYFDDKWICEHFTEGGKLSEKLIQETSRSCTREREREEALAIALAAAAVDRDDEQVRSRAQTQSKKKVFKIDQMLLGDEKSFEIEYT